jgi:UDP-N-acetylmuramate--alanine ligase
VHSVELGAAVSFRIAWEGRDFAVSLRVPGLHNALNAAGAFGVLVGLGFDPQRSVEAIAGFEGTERRFELRGEVEGVRVYDDFAHHPTEVRAALAGARAAVGGGGRLIPVFQPHLYSRTRLMAHEFAETFESLADHTIVVPIYPAREEPEPGVTGRLITDRFADPAAAEYVEDWDAAVARAVELARPGDIVMPMGGGDIYRIIPALLDALALGQRDAP